MSTAVSPAISQEHSARRGLPRYKVAVPLDVTVLRSGVPDRIPGRSLDISAGGAGLVLAGVIFPGESVGVQFSLPGVNGPVEARAVVRYQSQLRCGVEFLGLSEEQRALIRDWTKQEPNPPVAKPKVQGKAPTPAAPAVRHKAKGFRRPTRRLVVRIAPFLIAAALVGWWRWQKGWTEIEAQLSAQKAAVPLPRATLPASLMEQRLTHKVDPVYPDEARQKRLPGMVVLRAVIDTEGKVVKLEPVSGPEALAQSAMDAARWWRYEPYYVNGTPVEVETTLEVQFDAPSLTKE
ncbi:MAG: hypothetical protein DMG71_15120 [Acidobacteria bacterium]|nr:MAG: hypothetical protein DMG71_15120 [Acidobacteriota bacterium]